MCGGEGALTVTALARPMETSDRASVPRAPSPTAKYLLDDERELFAQLALTPPSPVPVTTVFDVDNSGQEVQRLSIITSLPELLKENHAECMRRIVPKIREVVRVAEADMQQESCAVFVEILEQGLVPVHNYTQTFLQTILVCMDNKDPEISRVWLDTLLDVIELLPKEVISKEILCKAIAKGQLSQPVQSRLASCMILGKSAAKFEPFVIKRDILPVVLSLCQDVDYEVRACMSRQLDHVARGLGLDETRTVILPELVELTNDEHCHVRLAGLDTVVSILSLLDRDAQVMTVVPLVCKYCHQAFSKQDETLSAVSRHFGRLCQGLSENLTEEQRKQFVDFYKRLCLMGTSRSSDLSSPSSPTSPTSVSLSKLSPTTKSFPINELPNIFDVHEQERDDEMVTCRQHAADNIPAMLSFVTPKVFRSELVPSFRELCCDSNARVRKTVASSFHQVAVLLGHSSNILIDSLIQLLHDDSIEVLGSGLISKLSETLDLMLPNSSSATSNTDTKMAELLDAVLHCEEVVSESHNWRLQEDVMRALSTLPRCFPLDVVNIRVVPLVFKKIHVARALPVRRAAVRTVLLLMRYMRRLEQHRDICHRLVQELARSRSFYERSLYIDMCTMSFELYSRAFFKDYFAEALLGLYDDSVPNIRLRLCRVLPQIWRTLQSTDKALRVLLETSTHNLYANERDHDVIVEYEKAMAAVSELPRLTGSNSPSSTEEDLQDEKKMAEEKRLLQLDESERKDQDQKKNTDRPSKTKLPVKTKLESKTVTQSSSGSALNSRNEKKSTSSSIPSAKGSVKLTSRTSSSSNNISLSQSSIPTASASSALRRKHSTPSLTGSTAAGSSNITKSHVSSPDGKKSSSSGLQRRTSLGSQLPDRRKL